MLTLIGFDSSDEIKNKENNFKLIVKQGMFEYYQDNLLVQTYITGPTSGRFAMFAKSGVIEFRNLKVYSLTPGFLSQYFGIKIRCQIVIFDPEYHCILLNIISL